jgi:membrane-bound metal-dependent hydrolase YbcI (DUF457 family)
MQNREHALSAFVGYVALGTLAWHLGPAALASGAATATGAGTVPDMDTQGSDPARCLGAATEGAAWAIHRLSGGHREGTHTAIGDGVAGGLAAVAIALNGWRVPLRPVFARWSSHIPQALLAHVPVTFSGGKVILWAYLVFLLAAAMQAVGHPRHHHAFWALAGATVVMVAGLGTYRIAWAVLAGAVIHCIGDSITKDGVAWLCPLSNHKLHLLPRHMRITTGHVVERRVIRPALYLAAGFLAGLYVVHLPIMKGVSL